MGVKANIGTNVVRFDANGRREPKSVAAARVVTIDYRSIVEKAVTSLTRNTADARREVYAQARTVVKRHLQLMRLPEPIVELEKLSLDLSIKRIEGQWRHQQTADDAINVAPRQRPAAPNSAKTSKQAVTDVRGAGAALIGGITALIAVQPRTAVPSTGFQRRPFRKPLGGLLSPVALAAAAPIAAMLLFIGFFIDSSIAYRSLADGPAIRLLTRLGILSSPGPSTKFADQTPLTLAPARTAAAPSRRPNPASAKLQDSAPSYALASAARAPEAVGPASSRGPTRVRPVRADFNDVAASAGADIMASKSLGEEMPGQSTRPIFRPTLTVASLTSPQLVGGAMTPQPEPVPPPSSQATAFSDGTAAGPRGGPTAAQPAGLASCDGMHTIAERATCTALNWSRSDPSRRDEGPAWLGYSLSSDVALPHATAANSPPPARQPNASAVGDTPVSAEAPVSGDGPPRGGVTAAEPPEDEVGTVAVLPTPGMAGIANLPAEAAKPIAPANSKAVTLIDSGKRAATKGDLDHAVHDFTEAIRLDPKYPEGYSERGQALFRMGETDRAITDYTAAVARDPQFGAAFRARGMAHLYRGATDLALADLSRAIELGKSDASLIAPIELFYALRSRAGIYNSKQQFENEIADCTALIEAYNGNSAVVEALKDNYRDVGASNILGMIYRQRAMAEIKLSNWESAIADLTAAIPVSFDRGYAALMDRAKLYETLGQRDQAVADVQSALSVKPGSEEARMTLRRFGVAPTPNPPPPR